MTTASICTIGDEILIGQIVDTNSSKIAEALNATGRKVIEMRSIGDEHSGIVSTLDALLAKSSVVITTGGLGPTKDDITKAALAELSGARNYVINKEQDAIMREILHSRGLDVLESNAAQASVPDTCEVIPNRYGTAPIMLFRFEAVRSAQDKKYVMMNAPKAKVEEITQVLPGIKSPTIIPLADDDWCSIHTVLDEKRFWEIIGKLKELGAQGILVTPIEKMIL